MEGAPEFVYDLLTSLFANCSIDELRTRWEAAALDQATPAAAAARRRRDAAPSCFAPSGVGGATGGAEVKVGLEAFVGLMRRHAVSPRRPVESESRFRDRFRAAVAELFRTLDVRGDAALSWDDFSKFVLDVDMATTVGASSNRDAGNDDDNDFEGPSQHVRGHEVPRHRQYERLGASFNDDFLTAEGVEALVYLPAPLHKFLVIPRGAHAEVVHVVTPSDPPRVVGALRHHTIYRPHRVITATAVPKTTLVVTSSTCGETEHHLSLWVLPSPPPPQSGESDRPSGPLLPVVVSRLDAPSAQTTLVYSRRSDVLLSSGPAHGLIYEWVISEKRVKRLGEPSRQLVLRRSYRLHAFGITSLLEVEQKHRESNLIITGSLDGSVRVWNPQDWVGSSAAAAEDAQEKTSHAAAATQGPQRGGDGTPLVHSPPPPQPQARLLFSRASSSASSSGGGHEPHLLPPSGASSTASHVRNNGAGPPPRGANNNNNNNNNNPPTVVVMGGGLLSSGGGFAKHELTPVLELAANSAGSSVMAWSQRFGLLFSAGYGARTDFSAATRILVWKYAATTRPEMTTTTKEPPPFDKHCVAELDRAELVVDMKAIDPESCLVTAEPSGLVVITKLPDLTIRQTLRIGAPAPATTLLVRPLAGAAAAAVAAAAAAPSARVVGIPMYGFSAHRAHEVQASDEYRPPNEPRRSSEGCVICVASAVGCDLYRLVLETLREALVSAHYVADAKCIVLVSTQRVSVWDAATGHLKLQVDAQTLFDVPDDLRKGVSRASPPWAATSQNAAAARAPPGGSQLPTTTTTRLRRRNKTKAVASADPPVVATAANNDANDAESTTVIDAAQLRQPHEIVAASLAKHRLVLGDERGGLHDCDITLGALCSIRKLKFLDPHDGAVADVKILAPTALVLSAGAAAIAVADEAAAGYRPPDDQKKNAGEGIIPGRSTRLRDVRIKGTVVDPRSSADRLNHASSLTAAALKRQSTNTSPTAAALKRQVTNTRRKPFFATAVEVIQNTTHRSPSSQRLASSEPASNLASPTDTSVSAHDARALARTATQVLASSPTHHHHHHHHHHHGDRTDRQATGRLSSAHQASARQMASGRSSHTTRTPSRRGGSLNPQDSTTDDSDGGEEEDSLAEEETATLSSGLGDDASGCSQRGGASTFVFARSGGSTKTRQSVGSERSQHVEETHEVLHLVASVHLNLMATVSRADSVFSLQLCVWDLELFSFLGTCTLPHHAASAMASSSPAIMDLDPFDQLATISFAPPYPILVGSTARGVIQMWRVPQCTVFATFDRTIDVVPRRPPGPPGGLPPPPSSPGAPATHNYMTAVEYLQSRTLALPVVHALKVVRTRVGNDHHTRAADVADEDDAVWLAAGADTGHAVVFRIAADFFRRRGCHRVDPCRRRTYNLARQLHTTVNVHMLTRSRRFSLSKHSADASPTPQVPLEANFTHKSSAPIRRRCWVAHEDVEITAMHLWRGTVLTCAEDGVARLWHEADGMLLGQLDPNDGTGRQTTPHGVPWTYNPAAAATHRAPESDSAATDLERRNSVSSTVAASHEPFFERCQSSTTTKTPDAAAPRIFAPERANWDGVFDTILALESNFERSLSTSALPTSLGVPPSDGGKRWRTKASLADVAYLAPDLPNARHLAPNLADLEAKKAKRKTTTLKKRTPSIEELLVRRAHQIPAVTARATAADRRRFPKDADINHLARINRLRHMGL